MRFRFRYLPALLAMGVGLWTPGAARGEQEMHRLKLDLDPLLDLSKVWDLTPQSVEQEFKAPNFRENPFISWEEGDKTAAFLTQPFSNVHVDLSVHGGELPLAEARVEFGAQRQHPQRLTFYATNASAASIDRLRTQLNKVLETTAQPGTRPTLGWKADAALKTEVWRGTWGAALLSQGNDTFRLSITPPGVEPQSEGFLTGVKRNRDMAFFVRLDQLLSVPVLWTMGTDTLEKSVALPGLKLSDSPFFKWNTTAKDSARFARQLFSNTTADLLMFDDAVNAEEANLTFKDGRVSKLVVTLLSRGNSGRDITAAKFDQVFKATGRALTQMLGVRATHTTVAGMTISKVDGYMWTTPLTLALLEYNVEAPQGKVEFLRLTFTPGTARSELLNLAGIGNTATTKALRSLSMAVKRDRTTGDVEIKGVPMRDQGQKGYCVAASCERLMRYLNIPCDMDELAQLVRADADRGASPAVMYTALQKIDQRFNMHMKLLKLPQGYSLGPNSRRVELERVWKADLSKVIQDNINQGLPLLWAVALPPGETGLAPETGGEGQTTPVSTQSVPFSMRAGHMRMIIGYNANTGGVIYTDSWGAGHERKVMSLADAQEMTTAVFSMTPSR